MKKNQPSMRSIHAARRTLNIRVHVLAEEGITEPSFDEEKIWRNKNPSPLERYYQKRDENRKSLRKLADSILLEAEMGRLTDEEFYAKVKAF